MPSFRDRLLNIAVGADETANAALGGDARETISGSIGRADIAGKWWAGAARTVVDGIFGQGHCLGEALKEQERRDRGA